MVTQEGSTARFQVIRFQDISDNWLKPERHEESTMETSRHCKLYRLPMNDNCHLSTRCHFSAGHIAPCRNSALADSNNAASVPRDAPFITDSNGSSKPTNSTNYSYNVREDNWSHQSLPPRIESIWTWRYITRSTHTMAPFLLEFMLLWQENITGSKKQKQKIPNNKNSSCDIVWKRHGGGHGMFEAS